MDAFINFVLDQNPRDQEILMYLHEKLTKTCGLSWKIRYKVPFYDQHSWICYMNPVKNGIELAFLHGRWLPENPILDFKKRKMVAGVTFKNVNSVDWKLIEPIVRDSMKIDQEKHQSKP